MKVRVIARVRDRVSSRIRVRARVRIRDRIRPRIIVSVRTRIKINPYFGINGNSARTKLQFSIAASLKPASKLSVMINIGFEVSLCMINSRCIRKNCASSSCFALWISLNSGQRR